MKHLRQISVSRPAMAEETKGDAVLCRPIKVLLGKCNGTQM